MGGHAAAMQLGNGADNCQAQATGTATLLA